MTKYSLSQVEQVLLNIEQESALRPIKIGKDRVRGFVLVGTSLEDITYIRMVLRSLGWHIIGE